MRQQAQGLLVAAAARRLARSPATSVPGRALSRRRQDKASPSRKVVTEALKDGAPSPVTGTYSNDPGVARRQEVSRPAIGGTMGYSYSAQVVEVTVDEETGEVASTRCGWTHDCRQGAQPPDGGGQVQGRCGWAWGQA